jgi:type IV pilus assembly protein PilN
MYSLDINFLNDRVERPSDMGPAATGVVQDNPVPLYVGVAVGVFLPVLALGLWFFLNAQNAELKREEAELDSQLAALQAQLSEVETINSQIARIEAQNRALATVFDRIKPWSAILQDIRDRVPTGVQIDSIQQTRLQQAAAPPPPSPSPSPGGEAPVPAPAPPPPPTEVIQVTGIARTFNDVNDFLLTLQRSPFLNAEETKIVGAQLVDNPLRVELSGEEQNTQVDAELPQVVQFTIATTLTNLPASQLLQDLERTLSVGLPARIEALREKGVIQR